MSTSFEKRLRTITQTFLVFALFAVIIAFFFGVSLFSLKLVGIILVIMGIALAMYLPGIITEYQSTQFTTSFVIIGGILIIIGIVFIIMG